MDKARLLRLVKDAMDRDWADPELDLEAVAAHALQGLRLTGTADRTPGL
jgi:hypothetical protein